MFCKFTDTHSEMPFFVNPLSVRVVQTEEFVGGTKITFDGEHSIIVKEPVNQVVKELQNAHGL